MNLRGKGAIIGGLSVPVFVIIFINNICVCDGCVFRSSRRCGNGAYTVDEFRGRPVLIVGFFVGNAPFVFYGIIHE